MNPLFVPATHRSARRRLIDGSAAAIVLGLALGCASTARPISASRHGAEPRASPAFEEDAANQEAALLAHYTVVGGYEGSDAVGTALFGGNDLELSGWGAELNYGEEVKGVLGLQFREYENEEDSSLTADSTEYYAGAMFFVDDVSDNLYALGLVRYSRELEFSDDTPSGDLWGWSLGAGLRVPVGEDFFLDARVVYEGLFDDFKPGSELGGWTGTVGFGIGW